MRTHDYVCVMRVFQLEFNKSVVYFQGESPVSMAHAHQYLAQQADGLRSVGESRLCEGGGQ